MLRISCVSRGSPSALAILAMNLSCLLHHFQLYRNLSEGGVIYTSDISMPGYPQDMYFTTSSTTSIFL